MTKKKTSTLTLVASLVLALTLCLSMALPVLAAPGGEAAETSEAAITKLLQVPVGTDIRDDIAYQFVVTKVSEDEEAPTAAMPAIGPITITFDGSQKLDGTAGDTETWYLESKDIFAGADWPHAGVYEYKITETDGTNTPNPAPPPTEAFSYSKAEYSVYVYVTVQDGNLVITHIGALMTKDDNSKEIGEEEQVKVDPTPGGGDGYDYSQLAFTNTYVKTNGGTTPETPDAWTLYVNKAVTGTLSDPSVYFSFDMTVTAPTLAPDVKFFTAYVVEKDPATPGKFKIVTAPANYAGTIEVDDSIIVASGSPLSFKLKDGQYLVFIDTPVGTSYTVTEAGVTGYTANAKITCNGVQGTNEAGAKGLGLKLPNAGNMVYTTPLYVGEKANGADFLNDRGTTTPTGIGVDNLPYIALLAVVLVALAGFVTIKSRRRASNNA